MNCLRVKYNDKKLAVEEANRSTGKKKVEYIISRCKECNAYHVIRKEPEIKEYKPLPCGKMMYPSEDEAKKWMDFSNKIRKSEGRELLMAVYFCDRCKAWHQTKKTPYQSAKISVYRKENYRS